MVKGKKSIYPIEDLISVNDKILLDENDNINSIRAVVSQFKKYNPHLGWEIKVVKNHEQDCMMIIRVK